MKRAILILATASLVLGFFSGARGAERNSNGLPPVSQALVREGDLAVELARELRLNTLDDEALAERDLAAAGIEPRGGWISDYPVTPVVLGQLQESIETAARTGALPMGRDEAMAALWRVAESMGLPLHAGDGSYSADMQSGQAEYEDRARVESYYSEAGPPVVSYYTPPWDYGYLYDWVPYPFWYGSFFLPGFFILSDFYYVDHGHDHDHDKHDHDHNHDGHDKYDDHRHNHHDKHITNHTFDQNGRSYKVDAANLRRTRMRAVTNSLDRRWNERFDAQKLNRARSILRRDSARFESFTRDRARDSGSAVDRAGSFRGNRGRIGPAERSLDAGSSHSNRSLGESRRFEYDGPRGGDFTGQRMRSTFDGSTMGDGPQVGGAPGIRPFHGDGGRSGGFGRGSTGGGFSGGHGSGGGFTGGGRR